MFQILAWLWIWNYVSGPEPGKIDHTLYCHVMNLEEPLHLQVQAEFKVLLALYVLMESTF